MRQSVILWTLLLGAFCLGPSHDNKPQDGGVPNLDASAPSGAVENTLQTLENLYPELCKCSLKFEARCYLPKSLELKIGSVCPSGLKLCCNSLEKISLFDAVEAADLARLEKYISTNKEHILKRAKRSLANDNADKNHHNLRHEAHIENAKDQISLDIVNANTTKGEGQLEEGTDSGLKTNDHNMLEDQEAQPTMNKALAQESDESSDINVDFQSSRSLSSVSVILNNTNQMNEANLGRAIAPGKNFTSQGGGGGGGGGGRDVSETYESFHATSPLPLETSNPLDMNADMYDTEYPEDISAKPETNGWLTRNVMDQNPRSGKLKIERVEEKYSENVSNPNNDTTRGDDSAIEEINDRPMHQVDPAGNTSSSPVFHKILQPGINPNNETNDPFLPSGIVGEDYHNHSLTDEMEPGYKYKPIYIFDTQLFLHQDLDIQSSFDFVRETKKKGILFATFYWVYVAAFLYVVCYIISFFISPVSVIGLIAKIIIIQVFPSIIQLPVFEVGDYVLNCIYSYV